MEVIELEFLLTREFYLPTRKKHSMHDDEMNETEERVIMKLSIRIGIEEGGVCLMPSARCVKCHLGYSK